MAYKKKKARNMKYLIEDGEKMKPKFEVTYPLQSDFERLWSRTMYTYSQGRPLVKDKKVTVDYQNRHIYIIM